MKNRLYPEKLRFFIYWDRLFAFWVTMEEDHPESGDDYRLHAVESR